MTKITYSSPLQLSEEVDSFVNIFTAGDKILECSFSWDLTIQGEYDNLLMKIDTLMKSEPLMHNGDILRDYDYIEYYRDITNIEEWLEIDTYHPNYLKGKTIEEKISLVEEHIDICNQLYLMKLTYEESLRWTCNVDINGEKVTALVEPGAWYLNQSLDVCFRFMSEKDIIGKNDLNTVTFEVEVYTDE